MLYMCQHIDPHCLHMTHHPVLHRWDAKSHMLLSQSTLVLRNILSY